MIDTGSITAGWVINDNAASTVAATHRPRRHIPMATMNAAAAHRNGSWPSITDTTSDGLTSTATAHHPRRRRGSAQYVAATVARAPATSIAVTTRSPPSGHSRAPTIHGSMAYGKA